MLLFNPVWHYPWLYEYGDAMHKDKGIMSLKTVRPEALGSEWVKKAASEGKVVVFIDSDRCEAERKAYMFSCRCKDFLAKGHTQVHMKVFFARLFAEHPEECVKAMNTKSKLRKFIACCVGEMLAEGIFTAKPIELAKALKFNTDEVDIGSVRRYVSKGLEDFFKK